jgi:hypothetical protein
MTPEAGEAIGITDNAVPILELRALLSPTIEGVAL